MIDLKALTDRQLVLLLLAAEEELSLRVADSDTLTERVNNWFETLKRTNRILGRYVEQLDREAIKRNPNRGVTQ